MSITITKQIKFCAGHRLLNHGGKCENFHGHNYRVDIHVTGETTDAIGRVVDFSVISELFKQWIDQHWDHGFLLWKEDTSAIESIRQVQPHKLFLMHANPTAENMALYLLEHVAPQLAERTEGRDIYVSKIVLWETDSSSAEVTQPRPSTEANGSWRANVVDRNRMDSKTSPTSCDPSSLTSSASAPFSP